MQSPANIQTILQNTLNPSLTNQAHFQLQRIRTTSGFVTQLLIIADNSKNYIHLRQSALVTLKNLISDHSQQGNIIAPNDWQIIKSSILEALIRTNNQKKLTPTIRQIIYLIAQKDYPENWTNIIPIIVNNIQTSQDFATIYGSVQALRAIISVFGKSITQQISLSNICNKVMISLLHLSSRLFQNFNDQTGTILLSIFKILETSIYFYLPPIILANIHNWMIFIKKILDVSIQQMKHMKKLCLKILLRIYQRHANSTINKTSFPKVFHEKYSVAFTETLIFQLLNPIEGNNEEKIEFVNLSLAPLQYIYKECEQCTQILNKYQDKLLSISFTYHAMKINNINSVQQFINSTRQNRSQLIEMFRLFLNDNSLGMLLNHVNKGSLQQQELALYIIAQISTQIKYADQMQGKMLQAIVQHILPILSTYDNQKQYLICARICQILKSYDYLNLPENIINNTSQQVYNCLMVKNNTYLNIYAAQAFTTLLKYDNIVPYVSPYLGDILQVYMKLMQEVEMQQVMNSMQQLLDAFGEQLAPFSSNLIRCFINTFYKYLEQKQSHQNKNKDQDDEDNLSQSSDQFQNTGKGCLASIRQILLAPLGSTYNQLSDDIFQLIVVIMRDREQLYLQEGLNLLNLMLYKCTAITQKYLHLFHILIYALIGIPKQLFNCNLPNEYQQMVSNICVDVDKDIVQNVIGSLRNYICKLNKQLSKQHDYLGLNFIQLLFNCVQCIHGNIQRTQTDRTIILTIFITLIQTKSLQVNENQLGRILSLVAKGMKYEQQQNKKPIYTSLYLQIIALSYYFYPETISFINSEIFVTKILQLWDKFTADYERQRILLGILCLFQRGQMKIQQRLIIELMHRLPKFIQEQAKNRNKTDDEIKSIEDQAEQQLDENSHMLGARGVGNIQEQDDHQWELEFNKLYESPLDKIDQIQYLSAVLKGPAINYVSILTVQQQELLSYVITNAEPRK